MPNNEFLKTKTGTWFLKKIEYKIIPFLIPRIPNFIETYHLTLFNLIWSVLIIIFSHLAVKNIYWLWGVNLCVFFQHITDMLDGALGRYRNTGLVSWGYYMDHFFDFIFLASLFVGYFFLFPKLVLLLFLIFILTTALMIHSFLYMTVTGTFLISHYGFGSSEGRYLLILGNVFLMYGGQPYFSFILKILLLFESLILSHIVWKTHQTLWEKDLSLKHSSNIKSKK